MGLLGFLRKEKRVFYDPELGALTYNSRSALWEGETAFPDARESVVVAIPGDEEGPSPQARALYEELARRYPILRDEVAAALYELYDNYRSDATQGDYEDGLPRLSAPGEIWGREPGATIELTDSFDWHLEHTFGVRIEDWKVSGVSVDG